MHLLQISCIPLTCLQFVLTSKEPGAFRFFPSVARGRGCRDVFLCLDVLFCLDAVPHFGAVLKPLKGVYLFIMSHYISIPSLQLFQQSLTHLSAKDPLNDPYLTGNTLRALMLSHRHRSNVLIRQKTLRNQSYSPRH